MFNRLSVTNLVVALVLALSHTLRADDPDIDAEMKKVLQNPNASATGSKADMKKLQKQAMDQINQAEAENKAEEAKKKAELQALVDQKGPATLPDWAPAVPQFTPAGPASRKIVDNEARIVVTGTSPVAPEALCEAYFNAAGPSFSREKTGSDINHNVDLFVNLRKPDDNSEVKLEAERKAGAKVTRVTISSPITQK
jgi:hypothetical protein